MTEKHNDWVNQFRQERLKGSARNPGTAALMSFFMMGMGQIYAGHIDRGIMLLALHLSGIFVGFSIYSGGIVYGMVFPLFGAHLLIVILYVLCVLFILIWIYNIKDAYYLALFSSFRDWFEVEKVLLPILKTESAGFLTADTGASPSLIESSDIEVLEEHEDARVVEIQRASQEKASEPAQESEVDEIKGGESAVDEQNFEPHIAGAEEVFAQAGIVGVRSSVNSWKLYLGFASILILLGLWMDKQGVFRKLSNTEDPTLFSVSASLSTVNEAIPAAVATVITAAQASDTSLPPVAPFVEGFSLLAAGRIDEAVASFEIDLKQHEPRQNDWKTILNAYYRSGVTAKYEAGLRSYLQRYPQDSDAWVSLGKIIYDRNELAEAAQALAQGLKVDPENKRGNYLLGSIYNDLKLYHDAIVHFKLAVKHEPLNLEFNRQLARAQSQAGDKDAAQRTFQRVLSISPGDSEARQAIMFTEATSVNIPLVNDDDNKVLVIQGKSDARVIDRSVDIDVPVTSQGKVLFDVEKDPVSDVDAKPISDETIIADVSDEVVPEKAPVIKAAAFITEKKTEEKSDKPAEKNRPVIRANAGISALEAGLVRESVEPVEAQKTKNKAEDSEFRDYVAQETKIEAAQNRLKELRQKGSYEFSRGNWEDALNHYLEILKDNKDAEAYEMAGLIFERLGMHKDAFAAVERSYQLGKKQTGVLARLGRLAEIVGDNAKGEFYLFHALQKAPHRVDLRIRYAKCLSANGKTDVAISELQSILKSNANSYAVRRKVESEIAKIAATN